MLQVFSINVYALLGETLSFLTFLVAMKLDVVLDVLDEPFSISTLVGDSIFDKTVYKGFPISWPNRVTLFDFVELDMLEFEIILRMDLLHVVFPPMIVKQG